MASELNSVLLQALLSPSAQCKRDGQWKEVEARELVPGDLIQLKGGDVIPADAKVTFPPITKAPILLSSAASINSVLC